MDFVDRAVEKTRMEGYIQDIHAKTAYALQPEHMGLTDYEADAGQVDKLKRRCAKLEQRVNEQDVLLSEERAARVRLEEKYAWLVTQMGRLALRVGPAETLDELDNDPDEVPFRF